MKKRVNAWSEKKEKLKNPNYVVSKTRLNCRNLPLQVEEKRLKEICIEGARKVWL
jgi:hypothetical protein